MIYSYKRIYNTKISYLMPHIKIRRNVNRINLSNIIIHYLDMYTHLC